MNLSDPGTTYMLIGARPVSRRAIIAEIAKLLPHDDQRRRWGVPRRSMVSRRKIAPLGWILWSRRRKRAAKITAKTALAGSFTRLQSARARARKSPFAASEWGRSESSFDFSGKILARTFPLPAARYWSFTFLTLIISVLFYFYGLFIAIEFYNVYF